VLYISETLLEGCQADGLEARVSFSFLLKLYFTFLLPSSAVHLKRGKGILHAL